MIASTAHPTPSAASLREWDRIIIGIDPGTNLMGYGILGVRSRKPAMIAMGVIELGKFADHYLRLRRIYERVLGLVEQYLPDEMAVEAPFFGKNVQSMLKLGRAQGVAIAAALARSVPITEYEPRKIKMAITGNGAASKEQVREMLRRVLGIPDESFLPQLDSTDALGAALCHFYETSKPLPGGQRNTGLPGRRSASSSWKDFVASNPSRVKGGQ